MDVWNAGGPRLLPSSFASVGKCSSESIVLEEANLKRLNAIERTITMNSYLSVSQTRDHLGTTSSGSKNFHVVSVDANREGLFNSIHRDYQLLIGVLIATFPRVRQKRHPKFASADRPVRNG